MTSTAPAAARAYRELLRVQRALFAGDLQARLAARGETRDQFMAHANAKPEEVPELIRDAYNTAGFLHENVVQTVRKDDGNYCARPTPTALSCVASGRAAPRPCLEGWPGVLVGSVHATRAARWCGAGGDAFGRWSQRVSPVRSADAQATAHFDRQDATASSL